MTRTLLALAAVLIGLALIPAGASAATCSEHSSQADAQRAKDTRDADGDGVFCESLPCPCAGQGGSGGSGPAPAPAPKPGCVRPKGVQRIVFARSRFPNIRRHYVAAVRSGWPKVLVINRGGADDRRDRLLRGVATRRGFDRDEYPAAVGRGRANGAAGGLVRGSSPRGWKADVAYVRSSENRSHGATLGNRLRRFCDGTRFRYVFR
ncbi:MAG: hypothetical protein H0T43_02085 [Solirubrobacterales bacterium]|nr:hypothetical protein [Solirubrobacterales bacterium]